MAPLGMDCIFAVTICTSYYIARSSRTQDKRRIFEGGIPLLPLDKGINVPTRIRIKIQNKGTSRTGAWRWHMSGEGGLLTIGDTSWKISTIPRG